MLLDVSSSHGSRARDLGCDGYSVAGQQPLLAAMAGRDVTSPATLRWNCGVWPTNQLQPQVRMLGRANPRPSDQVRWRRAQLVERSQDVTVTDCVQRVMTDASVERQWRCDESSTRMIRARVGVVCSGAAWQACDHRDVNMCIGGVWYHGTAYELRPL